MRPFPFISALALTVLITIPLAAQTERRVPTVDDLLQVQRIDSARISPDASHVLYTQTGVDFEDNAFAKELWRLDATTKVAIKLTRAPRSISSPQWSPNGKWITFIATETNNEEKAQLYALNTQGGDAFPLTKSKAGIVSYEWSRDGYSIAFTAKDEKPKTLEKRKEHLGDFSVIRKEYVHTHLYTFDFATARNEPQEGTRRTEGNEYTVLSFDWSPDGSKIAFSAMLNPDRIYGHTADIFVVTLEDNSVERVVDTVGPDLDPKWAPTGDRIAYESTPRELYYPYNQQIYVTPAEGGIPYSITEKFDEDASLVAWRDEGIYFTGREKMASHFYRVDPLGESQTRLSQPPDLMGRSFSLAQSTGAFAVVADTSRSLPDVFLHRPGHALPVPLTNTSMQTRDFILGSRERIEWSSDDGTPIEGVLIKPKDFDEDKQYPLLVIIHGGPTGIDTTGLLNRGTRYYPVDTWVGRGALVLRVNYRGSAGYGEEFRKLNMRNLGVGDAEDVLSGVDYLIEQGWVDEDRMGCMGWSQGGYISAFLTTHTDRFAAISVGAGISNWATYYYNTDITPFTPNYLEATPSSDPDIYLKTSPMTTITDAKTPTLIQHGENDTRVPIPNAYELRQGLVDNGVDVEMIVYNGFGHGITKPRSMRAVMQHNLHWFNHYLFDDPLPDFANPQLPEDDEDSE